MALLRLQPSINKFLRHGLLIPCNSPWNTPILPAKKPSGQYRLVQDLRIINEAVIPIHPLVPNPYTLLRLIPLGSGWFTALDLQDAFFCILLDPQSQFLFLFTRTHHTLMFAANILGLSYYRAFESILSFLARLNLHGDLRDLSLSEATILQYVDDFLICSPDKESSDQHTIITLNFLAEWAPKAQISNSK